jgi:hypothetical protein
MLVNTWQETENHLDVRFATNSIHIEIYWAHKKLNEAQHLKIYQFLQHSLWLKIYHVYCYVSPDTLEYNRYMTKWETVSRARTNKTFAKDNNSHLICNTMSISRLFTEVGLRKS